MPSRRELFKTLAGLGLGASTFGLTQPTRSEIRVGVLTLPGAYRFDAALQNALGQRGVLDLRVIGYTPGSAVKHAEALLEAKAVVLVALGDGLEDTLGPIAERYAVPLILSEVGVIMPRRASASPFVFKSGLRQWQAEWAMGEWSAKKHKTAVIVTGMRDAGYDLPYAFRSGFEAAGGKVLATLVTDIAGKHDFDAVRAEIRLLAPDTVHLIGSRSEDLEFAHLPGVLSLSGFSLGGLPGVLQGAYCANTYGSALDAMGLEVLGQRTGQWLRTALERQEPRGLLYALRQTTSTQAIQLYHVRRSSSVAVQTLAEPPAFHPALHNLSLSPRSGWTNLYPYV